MFHADQAPKQGKVEKQAEDERERMKEEDADEVDLAADDSFPASDPPSHTPVKGQKKAKPDVTEKDKQIRQDH